MNASGELPGQAAARRIVLLAALMIALSLLLSGYAALKVFEAAIQPELEKRASLIGRSVRGEVEHALEIGIPFNALAGVDRYLEGVIADFPEVHRIALIAADNTVVAEVSHGVDAGPSGGETGTAPTGKLITSPMLNGNTLVGKLVLEIDVHFVTSKMRNILLDVAVFGLIAVLLSFELVIWTISNEIGKPLDRVFQVLREQSAGVFRHVLSAEGAGGLMRVARRLSDRVYDLRERRGKTEVMASIQRAYFSDVRLPLFLFSTATEISSAFLPIYARDAVRPVWLSDEMAATAPLVAYLLAIAVASLFGGRIAARVGAARLFLLCVPLTAVALIGVGLGRSLATIALFHGAMAAAYALATIACQSYALAAAGERQSARALGANFFVVMGGVVCGAALGGVLADRIGTTATFVSAAGLAMVSGVLGYVSLLPHVGKAAARTDPSGAATGRRSGSILANPRFLALLAGVSGPKNIAMSVFVWYITPLALEAGGADFADIGRVVMIYCLVSLLVLPSVADMADGRVGYVAFLIVGLALSGLALTSLFFWNGFWPVAVAVGGLGLGNAMIDATHHAHAIGIARNCGLAHAEMQAMSAVRLTERLSAIAGLLIAAIFLKQYGYVTVTVLIGLVLLAGAAIVALAEGGSRVRRAGA